MGRGECGGTALGRLRRRDLENAAVGLTTLRDGRTAFFPRVDSSIDGLMVVDGFR